MSNSVRKKPVRRSRKTATTKAAKGCGSVIFRPVSVQDNIKPSKSVMKRLEKEILSFFVETIIGKFTESIGPNSPSGCAKNISNAAAIGLGRRPKNLWLFSAGLAPLGYLHKTYKLKLELPMRFIEELAQDDLYPGLTLKRGVSL